MTAYPGVMDIIKKIWFVKGLGGHWGHQVRCGAAPAVVINSAKIKFFLYNSKVSCKIKTMKMTIYPWTVNMGTKSLQKEHIWNEGSTSSWNV